MACLAVVLAAPACVLVAPFDSSLMEVDETEPGGNRARQIGGGGGGEPLDAGPDPAPDPHPDPEVDADGGADAGAPVGAPQDAGPDGAAGLCDPGDVRDCYPGPEAEVGTGICRGGTQSCAVGGAGWAACEGAVTAAVEACGNGLDDDCDGAADEDCAPVEVVWCWSCSAINLFTDNATCAIAAVPAHADGSCPDGSSLEVPECEPCRVCSVIQGFCETPECCGDWQGSQTVGQGCSCWGCPGQGEATTAEAAIVEAEQAGLAFCEFMPAEYDSACGDYMNGCYVRSCGSAASCE